MSAMLTDALKNCSNVTVYHFDGWAKSNNVTRNFQDKAQANDHSCWDDFYWNLCAMEPRTPTGLMSS